MTKKKTQQLSKELKQYKKEYYKLKDALYLSETKIKRLTQVIYSLKDLVDKMKKWK